MSSPTHPEGHAGGAGGLTVRDVVTVWWPLAASWLFMSLELPLVSAVLARLERPEIQLAAFGGVVFPLMLLIEGDPVRAPAFSTRCSRRSRPSPRTSGPSRRCIWAAGLHRPSSPSSSP